jgi:transcriptional regulator with GAF, ATPase, and Fis domain
LHNRVTRVIGYRFGVAESGSTRSLRDSTTSFVRQFELVVVEGTDRGLRVASSGDELTIGTSAGNDLQLSDPAVSRHHCVVRITSRGLELRDLASTNGTIVAGCEIATAIVPSGSEIRIGATIVKLDLLAGTNAQPLACADSFDDVIGASPVMRRVYATLERCAATHSTVLIEGETGTGKELIAETIHGLGPRRARPFVVVDCAALPAGLIESELFGHVAGAFTGGDSARIGAFETAHGGTLLLDEIGELPLALQPVLLRAIENRTIRPIGSNEQRAVDVRVIAATNRDLRIEVNHKRFRPDLFYRLNVVRVVLPPLRERTSDIPALAEHFWKTFSPETSPPPELVADFAARSWPGNVRELRNAVERAVSLGKIDVARDGLSYGDAKERAIAEWERAWVAQQLAAAGGNLSRAARDARMSRRHLRELARRYDLLGRDDPDEP